MRKASAGLLMFRRGEPGLEVFLVHPGGPFYAHRDEGAWTIPKGEIEPEEDPLSVAKREFREETGRDVEDCRRAVGFVELGSVRQSGGKQVEAWAFEGEWPVGEPVRSNRFTIEWPPRSGKQREFPEVDRGQFFDAATARRKILSAQAELIDRLAAHLGRLDAPRTGSGH